MISSRVMAGAEQARAEEMQFDLRSAAYRYGTANSSSSGATPITAPNPMSIHLLEEEPTSENEQLPFGAWLKALRKSRGLTQQEFGKLVDYSAVAILKIEGGQRRPSRQVAERMAEALRLPPQERDQFVYLARVPQPHTERVGWKTRLPTSEPAVNTSHNLPDTPGHFIGREAEINTAAELLRDSVRLLTLVGPPGIGKTRLATRLGEQLLDRYRDGVYFVALEGVSDPAQVMARIATTLAQFDPTGQIAADTVHNFLRPRHALLVLDNFEQVLPAAAALSDLLDACPLLRVIVTSRSRLQLRRERELVVPPLKLPDTRAALSTDQLLRCEAIRHFVECACVARADFHLTTQNAAAVLEICTRLNGVPLAIELVAANVRYFSPQRILAMLAGTNMLSITGPLDLTARQRTLRGAIAWSYDLLTPDEQALFRRLGVFANSFSETAAASICGGDEDGAITWQLMTLVDRNLLRVEDQEGEEPRFAMLSMVQEFAVEQLQSSDEGDTLRARHLSYYLARAEAAQPHLRGPERQQWLKRLELDYANFQAALTWALERSEVQPAIRLGAALWRLCYYGGFINQGRCLLEQVIELSAAAGDDPDATAGLNWVLHGAAVLASTQGDTAAAAAWVRRSIALARASGDAGALGSSLNLLGVVEIARDDLDSAALALNESSAIFHELKDDWSLGFVMLGLVRLANTRGDLARAEQLSKDAAAAFANLDDKRARGLPLGRLGELTALKGDFGLANDYFDEFLSASYDIGDRWGIADALSHLAWLAMQQGDYKRAANLFREAITGWAQLGMKQQLISNIVGAARLAQLQGVPVKAALLYGALEQYSSKAEATTTVPGIDMQAEFAAFHASADFAQVAASWQEGTQLTLEQAAALACDRRLRGRGKQPPGKARPLEGAVVALENSSPGGE